MPRQRVVPIKFELSRTSAPTGVAVTLYRPNATTGVWETFDPTTLPNLSGVAITDVVIVQVESGMTTLFHGASDAVGVRVLRGNFATNGGICTGLETPYFLPPKTELRLTSAAANIEVCGTGFIYIGLD